MSAQIALLATGDNMILRVAAYSEVNTKGMA